MTPGLSPTIIQSRSLLQLTSSTRTLCLLHYVTRPSVLPPALLHNPHPPPPSFSTSTPRLRRTGTNNNHWDNQSSETPSFPYFSSAKSVSNSSNPAETSPPPDVLDFSQLDAAHQRLVAKLRDDLVKLKPGGLDLDAVEAVRVNFKPGWRKMDTKEWWKEKEKERKGKEKGEKKEEETARVGDLAQVLVRGRVCVVMVGEKEHVKPLLSSLQNSLTSLPAPPTHTPTTPLEIHIPIPPTTGESRAEAQLAAKKLGDKTIEKWTEARSAERKRMKAIETNRTGGNGGRVSKDVILKADLRLAKTHEKVVGEVRALVENARRRLGGG